MSLESDAAYQVLVSPLDDTSGYYVLMTADLDDDGLQKLGDGPDAVGLVRIDKKTQQVAIVMMPAHTLVTLSDGETHTLREAGAWGDDELVEAVSALAGVDIAHFVKTDAQGVHDMVAQVGGISVNLTEEIDDPQAGSVFIPAGEQKIDETQVLTLLRSTNLKGSLNAQAANQMMIMTALGLDALQDGTWSFMRNLDSLARNFTTSMSTKEAEAVAKNMRGIGTDNVQGALAPGYERQSEGAMQYVCSEDSLQEMLARAEQGQALIAEDTQLHQVDPSSFTITVRNGSGVTGGATEMAETLTNYGYDVTETGNTDTYAYTETLVIYLDDQYAGACESVVNSLGVGRVVDGAGFYTFDTDVLVVLGSDWAPAS